MIMDVASVEYLVVFSFPSALFPGMAGVSGRREKFICCAGRLGDYDDDEEE